jgi:hypothetical protein
MEVKEFIRIDKATSQLHLNERKKVSPAPRLPIPSSSNGKEQVQENYFYVFLIAITESQ